MRAGNTGVEGASFNRISVWPTALDCDSSVFYTLYHAYDLCNHPLCFRNRVAIFQKVVKLFLTKFFGGFCFGFGLPKTLLRAFL